MFDKGSLVTFAREQCEVFAIDAEWIFLAVCLNNPQIKTKYSH